MSELKIKWERGGHYARGHLEDLEIFRIGIHRLKPKCFYVTQLLPIRFVDEEGNIKLTLSHEEKTFEFRAIRNFYGAAKTFRNVESAIKCANQNYKSMGLEEKAMYYSKCMDAEIDLILKERESFAFLEWAKNGPGYFWSMGLSWLITILAVISRLWQ